MKNSICIQSMVLVLALGVAAPVAAQSDSSNDSPALPDMARTLFINSLLPGTAQIALGDVRTGRRILVGSLALNVAGLGLLVADLIRSNGINEATSEGIGFYRHEDRTYLWPVDDNLGLIKSDWIPDTGLLLLTWGSLLTAYSGWAAYRDYADHFEIAAPRTGHERLRSLLIAPYKADNIFNLDFFPFFPMTILGQLEYDDLSVYRRFFEEERVDFWGFDVVPALGLALNSLFAFAFVHANATGEEIIFRGLQLESRGVARSSISFGIGHLPNMIIPGVSIEDTIFQTIFATLFGFYAADRVRSNEYRFERAVALHFWHNIAAFTLGYMEAAMTDDDGVVPGIRFTITIRS